MALETLVYQVDVIGRVTRFHVPARQLDFRGRRILKGLLVNELLAHHRGEDLVAPGFGSLRVAVRIEVTRPLRQSGQQGGLGQRDIPHVFVEESPGSFPEAVDIETALAPHEDLVRVVLEDLLLGEPAFKLDCDHGLGKLATHRRFPSQEEVPSELLGQR